MRESNVGGIPFALLDWNDLDRLTRELADKVLASGIKYDRIVPLANGGLTMARHFADLIDLRVISEMQVALYRGINEAHSEPKIIQPLSVSIAGERIIVFEDIVDSGKTLEFSLPKLLALGAKEVHTASLFRKSHASVHPEYSAKLLDKWVIFPYETRETISELSQKWQAEKHSQVEISQRLSDIGFGAADIRLFA